MIPLTLKWILGSALIAAGLVMGLFSAQAALPNLETVIHSFLGGTNDGWDPESKLIADEAGNFYGTTGVGGPACSASTEGCGTVYQITPDGQVTILYAFVGGSDGYFPRDGLFRDSSGNFYGTTSRGGDSDLGTVFKLTPDGTKTTLYSFAGGNDGSSPNGDLIADAAGNLYGTTASGGGGGGSGCRDGCGTVFRITPDGQESVVHSFLGITQSDGAVPTGGLFVDARGNFYGATSLGGNAVCTPGGCGTIFRITADGRERVLYAFAGGTDGNAPNGNLISDQRGNLYGTTVAGSSHGFIGGTVFKLSRRGVHTVLHTFVSGTDGVTPEDGVVADAAGNLFGTTAAGGDPGFGTVFKLTRSGQETILHSFQGGPSDGFAPYAAVILGGDGKLYGTAIRGGAMDKGVVFSVDL